MELHSLGVPSCVGAFEHQHTSKSKGIIAFSVVPLCFFPQSAPRALIERSRAAFPAPKVHNGAFFYHSHLLLPPPPTATTTTPLATCCFGGMCLCCRGAFFNHPHLALPLAIPLPAPTATATTCRFGGMCLCCRGAFFGGERERRPRV